VNNVNAYIASVSLNIDALREAVLCQTEILRQSQLDRDFHANHFANLERILINNANQLAQILYQIAQAVSGREIPASELNPETFSDPLDNLEFPPCSSQQYCPPGQIRNPTTGQCEWPQG
jgi:hypothetical protein